jgi:hypothetical protein
MDKARPSDQGALDAFYEQSTALIEELVNGALQRGHPVHDVALVLERGFDGKVIGACGARTELMTHFTNDRRLDESTRRALVDGLRSAPPNEIPAVFVVHGEGMSVAGIRRLPGAFAALS